MLVLGYGLDGVIEWGWNPLQPKTEIPVWLNIHIHWSYSNSYVLRLN